MIIIGIDPGSRMTGYGLIRLEGNKTFYLDSGCIRVTAENTGIRLQQIYNALKAIIQQYQPHEAAIEQIFMHQNPGSALKLGQARGAAIASLDLPVSEYSARQVKLSVVGFGAAKKEQVQHMVLQLLSMTGELQADAADALAIALCHAHTRFSLQKIGLVAPSRKKRNSWRDYQPITDYRT
ncbi:MAG: ruvC [Gammaproteobacteria bacterium]|jgi:crossover junction endodeoxyribonuclease RuvC|nr:ruvC [Gammaproteobacteria bacterium]MCE3237155.1 ruvC [Gammaproteobacteria bacterium]